MARDITDNNLALEPHQIIFRPLVTEKGLHKAERYNQYAFEVHPLASKEQIRQAVESLFDVKVVQVRTQNRRGKPRRHRFVRSHTKTWKKAVITLDPNDKITFF